MGGVRGVLRVLLSHPFHCPPFARLPPLAPVTLSAALCPASSFLLFHSLPTSSSASSSNLEPETVPSLYHLSQREAEGRRAQRGVDGRGCAARQEPWMKVGLPQLTGFRAQNYNQNGLQWPVCYLPNRMWGLRRYETAGVGERGGEEREEGGGAGIGEGEGVGPLFSKLLVANRGEIACRVLRTASRLGIPTVAIHSDVDAEALHVRMADEAVCVGPAPATQSYLNVDAILKAVRDTGATAVHPGYGFLSENAGFVTRLGEECPGVAWVGPHAGAIGAMGDKIHSKALARAAGVRVIPGVEEEVRDAAHAVRIAAEVGYPVMLKASGGGGGKGMRVARNAREVEQAYALCRGEAQSAFGDPRLFLERFIEQPRHIEVQLLGDRQGAAVWLPERECSIQRRNQKVLEEAPSPFLDPPTRQAMGEQAVRLAQAVGYDSAGTVEFLVDQERNFYFLEMNTRLQVEHPVTECVTGLDLVEIMLRLAKGTPLHALPLPPLGDEQGGRGAVGLTQERAAKIHGWAMEARVCCEQPGLQFLPSTGQLRHYVEPAALNEVDTVVRVDSGVTEGDDVTMHYDPLLAKLVTWGPTRGHALGTLQRSLDAFFVAGPAHNIPFLRCIVSHSEFEAGHLSTSFLPTHFPKGAIPQPQPRILREAAAVAAFLTVCQRRTALSATVPPSELLKQEAEHQQQLTVFGLGRHPIQVAVQEWPQAQDPSLAFAEVELEEERILVEETERGATQRQVGVVRLQLDGMPMACQVLSLHPRGLTLLHRGHTFSAVRVLPRDLAPLERHMPAAGQGQRGASPLVKSPMPGAVVGVAVRVGQEVLVGSELLTIEAMKMRNVLRAERAGRVRLLFVKEGQTVKLGDNLVEIEPNDS